MTGASGAEKDKTPARGIVGWCFYDWANSAFPTVITTFVFAAYFTKAIAADEITGTSQWGWALSLSGLAVAVAAPRECCPGGTCRGPPERSGSRTT